MKKKVQIVEKSCHREGLKVQRLRNFLTGNGYEVLEDKIKLDPTNKYAFPLEELEIDPEADIIILTTCGFSQSIEDGDFEALEIIKKNKKPSAQIILGGCIVKINPDRVNQEFDGPTFDNFNYNKLDEILNPTIPFEEFVEPHNMPNTDRFFIQIQSGCPNRCTFCAIWKTLGKNVSKPIQEVLDEFHKGLSEGHKKIYLIGECAGSYGLDLKKNLGDLFIEFTKINEDFQLVIEDVSPKYVESCIEALKELARQRKIESFHSPIQSGNDRILKLMGRKYDMEKFRRMLLELKEIDPNLILSSAVIVGFPSETREELEESISFCKNAMFDTVACHIFSARPGAKAAEMPDQIPHEEMVWRYNHFKASYSGITRVDPNQRKLVEV